MKLRLMFFVIVGLLSAVTPAIHAAQAFADPAFQEVWSRTDAAVAAGQSNRSWLWGPQPLSMAVRDRYLFTVTAPEN